MTSGLRVRPARTSDMRAIRALVSPLAERRILLQKEAVAYYEATGDFVVAELDDRIVGCGAVHVLWEDLAEIRTLAVAPAASGEGIGEALTRAMIDLARDGGFGSVVLSSSTTMRAAHRLYERLGFVRLPERDWTPGRGIQLVAYELPLA